MLATAVSVARLLIPELEAYREDIQARISERIEAPVKIGMLAAGMRGFLPELVLKQVDVFDVERLKPTIRFDEISVGVDIKHLIFQQQLRPLWVSVVGADLSIKRKKTGGISIVGLKSDDDPPYWLFEGSRFEFLRSQVSWQDLKTQSDTVRFPLVDLTISNDGDFHQIRFNAKLPENLGDTLKILADYQGDIFLAQCCKGRLFIEGEKINLANLPIERNFQDYRITSGTGNVKLWSKWLNSSIQSVSGYVDLINPGLVHDPTSNPQSLSFDALTGWFRWLKNDGGWQMDANRLTIETAGHRWPESQLAIASSSDDQGTLRRFDAASSHFRLESLTQLMTMGPLQENDRTLLRGLAASGALRDFNFSYRMTTDGSPILAGCGEFQIDNINPYLDYPGMKQWSGYLCSDQTHGAVTLASKQGELNYPTYFRRSLPIKSMSGTLAWEMGQQGWSIATDGFQINTSDLSLDTRLAFSWQAGSNHSLMDWQASFQQQNPKNVGSYLPVSIMDDELVEWLDLAFDGGTVENGQLLFYGPVAGYPFRQAQGVLDSRFDVKNMKLRFHEEWLPVTGLDAEVRFKNETATVSVHSAKLLRGVIKNTTVHFPDMIDKDYLLVDGEVRGEISQTLRYLQQSPLRSEVNPLLKVANFNGVNVIDLHLKIPLNDSEETKVKGLAKLAKGSVFFDALKMKVSDINGVVTFTEDDFEGKDINAKMLNSPAHFHVTTGKNHFHLSASGSTRIEQLKKQFPFSFWNYFNGRANYDLRLTIPKLKKGVDTLATDIKVTSNLLGVEVALPKPFAKSPSKSEDFQLSLSLAESQKMPVTIRYGELARGDLTFSSPESKKTVFHGGTVLLGAGTTQKSNDLGLNFSVDIDQIDLESWWLFYDSQKPVGAGASAEINNIDLVTKDLLWGDRHYGPVEFNWREETSGWAATIKSNYADGKMQGPLQWKKDSFLSMEFDHLKFPKTEKLSSTDDSRLRVDPSKLPNMRIKSRHLYWNNKDLGELELHSQQQVRGLNIDRFNIKSKHHNLSLTGHWIHEGSKALTELDGHLNFVSLGQFLQDHEISDELKDTAADIDFELEWYGPLYDPGFEKLNGYAKVDLKKGRLLGVEPGIGRALGVLSLDTWRRRLSLDFSDLYAEGLAYDKIKGDFFIKNGDAYTDKLEIDAVSANIYSSGRIGLARKDFDQTITVVPKSSASLPIAGAIAGGPAVGAAIFVAQKLIGDDVDSIASTQYALKGPWNDLQVKQLQGKGGILDKAWTGIKDVTGIRKQVEVENNNNEE